MLCLSRSKVKGTRKHGRACAQEKLSARQMNHGPALLCPLKPICQNRWKQGWKGGRMKEARGTDAAYPIHSLGLEYTS